MGGVGSGVAVRGSGDALPEDNGEPLAEPYASPSDQRPHRRRHRLHQRNRPRNGQVSIDRSNRFRDFASLRLDMPNTLVLCCIVFEILCGFG